MNVKWTENEKNFIKSNAHCMKDEEIAEVLTRQAGRDVSVYAVRKKRQEMGILKKFGRGICALRDSPTAQEK